MSTPAELKKQTEQKMLKSIDALKQDLGKVRTGRAHTGSDPEAREDAIRRTLEWLAR